jgi:hypothetical protein
MPQVILGGYEAPTTLPPLETNPLELAEQVAEALTLAELFYRGPQGALGDQEHGTPPIRPWAGSQLPPGPLVTPAEAELPPGECVAPPRVPTRGRPKKARLRRP